jgi:hypothetical protein
VTLRAQILPQVHVRFSSQPSQHVPVTSDQAAGDSHRKKPALPSETARHRPRRIACRTPNRVSSGGRR